MLAQVTLDVAFLGVDGWTWHGASAHHEGEASVNHLLITRAARVVVVADFLEDREESIFPYLPRRADRHPRHRRTASRPGRDPALRRRSDRGQGLIGGCTESAALHAAR